MIFLGPGMMWAKARIQKNRRTPGAGLARAASAKEDEDDEDAECRSGFLGLITKRMRSSQQPRQAPRKLRMMGNRI